MNHITQPWTYNGKCMCILDDHTTIFEQPWQMIDSQRRINTTRRQSCNILSNHGLTILQRQRQIHGHLDSLSKSLQQTLHTSWQILEVTEFFQTSLNIIGHIFASHCKTLTILHQSGNSLNIHGNTLQTHWTIRVNHGHIWETSIISPIYDRQSYTPIANSLSNTWRPLQSYAKSLYTSWTKRHVMMIYWQQSDVCNNIYKIAVKIRTRSNRICNYSISTWSRLSRWAET